MNADSLPVSASLDQLEASICRDSFYQFVKRFWETIPGSGIPVWNWHIKCLCDEMQAMAERVFQFEPREYDLLINVPPGSTKSMVCTRMFPMWAWTRMPAARTICGSFHHPLAVNLSRESRCIVYSDKFKRLFPEIVLSDDQDAKGFYANTKGGFRLAVGTGGVAGFHAHFIVVDDPLNPDPNAVVSEAEIKAANNWVQYLTATRQAIRGVTARVMVMQRAHQDDPAGCWIDLYQRGKIRLRHICLPAEIESEEDRKRVRPRAWAKNYVDGLLDPVRLSRKTLAELRAGLSDFIYASQMQQCPIPLGGGMFKIDRFEIEQDHPPKFKMVVRFWDKAGSKKKGAYTAGIKMGRDFDNRFWILDVTRGQWSSDVREAIIKQTAQIDGHQVLIGEEQEPGSGGLESADNTIKNLAGFRVFKYRPSGDKVLRADAFSVQVNVGNVRLLEGEWNADYRNELQFFPFSKYKDQVDASSGAFSMLTRAKRAGGFGR